MVLNRPLQILTEKQGSNKLEFNHTVICRVVVRHVYEELSILCMFTGD